MLNNIRNVGKLAIVHTKAWGAWAISTANVLLLPWWSVLILIENKRIGGCFTTAFLESYMLHFRGGAEAARRVSPWNPTPSWEQGINNCVLSIVLAHSQQVSAFVITLNGYEEAPRALKAQRFARTSGLDGDVNLSPWWNVQLLTGNKRTCGWFAATFPEREILHSRDGVVADRRLAVAMDLKRTELRTHERWRNLRTARICPTLEWSTCVTDLESKFFEEID